MKIIKLINLRLENFKGIKEFDLKLDGLDADIFGKNASGKTTIKDAFTWLLFDKDSNNKATSNFNIKTIGDDGKVINMLDHVVEAIISVDDVEKKLKKVYMEKWNKKSGAAQATFTGHTTKHFINEVPVSKKDYDNEIDELVEEEAFKLLTDPSYFNEILHWEKRREVLLELAGDITDEEIINSDDKLKKISEFLNNNTIDDHKKIIASKKSNIKKELDHLPTRVDEINHNMPDISDLKEEDINTSIDKLNAEISTKNEQINSIKNGSEAVEIKKQISELEIELNKVKANHDSEQSDELHKLETKLKMENTNLELYRDSIRPHIQNKKTNEQMIASNEQEMDSLRNEFKELSKKIKEQSALTFDKHSLTCPTCSQELPESEKENAEAKFNKDKSDLIESYVSRQDEIQVKGKTLAEENEGLKQLISEHEKEIEKITKQAEVKTEEIERITKQVESTKNLVQPVEENLKVIQLNNEIKELKERSLNIVESTESEITKIESEINELEAKVKELNNDLNKFEQVKVSTNRIEQLKEEERKLAHEFEELDMQSHLIEQFTRTKVKMLNEKINKKFKYARFNLFRETIEGNLVEICETTYKNVPFSSGLNNAARVNVGLDIINTLSKHYGVQAPIFIDNAEGVTDLINTESQLISLIVSKDDKVLRVEK